MKKLVLVLIMYMGAHQRVLAPDEECNMQTVFEECIGSSRRQEFPATPQAFVGNKKENVRERDAVHRQSSVCNPIHLLCQ